jgi:molecular chaperone DnaK
MSDIAVGIDLGTSNSCVSIMREGKVEVLANVYDESTTASVVAFSEGGEITVGNQAKANIIHDPAHTVSSAKRLIGRYSFSEEVKKAKAIFAYDIIEGPNHSVRINIRNEEFSLPEISAMVLREMKQIAETRLGEPVSKAVITVPAYFNDNQRQATKDAGRIAGLEVLRILNEPTAAALAYGFGKSLNQRVAVYDLGGGTFDISVLEIGRDVFEVLATCGDTFLGGDDFDDRVLDLLADEFVAKAGVNPRNDPFAFERLKSAAEKAKNTLSVEEEAFVKIDNVLTDAEGNAHGLERTISQGEFASLVQDLIQRTFKVCDEALQQSDLTTRDLDGVILVGGPTRLPVIREAVKAYFQQEPKHDVDPDQVVAMGAAIHAASLVGAADSQDSMLLDVTPLDLRIGVAGGLAEPIIERNTPVPIEQTRSFTTIQDMQETVIIKVYQGDDRQADGNELLGQFAFSGFEPAPRGEVQIDVTFEINADGIVNVMAMNPANGEQASTTITLSSGLSEDELDAILASDPTARVATAGAPAGGATALEPVDLDMDDMDDLETDDLETDDLDLADMDEGAALDLDEIALTAATVPKLDDEPASAGIDPHAVSAPDLSGSPDEPVQLEAPPTRASSEFAGAAPTDAAPAEAVGDSLFGEAGGDLSAEDLGGGDLGADEDELELLDEEDLL